jgi:hypothetical protein
MGLPNKKKPNTDIVIEQDFKLKIYSILYCYEPVCR